jgi:hypothetical protein
MNAPLRSLILQTHFKAWEARRVMKQTDLQGALESIDTASLGSTPLLRIRNLLTEARRTN